MKNLMLIITLLFTSCTYNYYENEEIIIYKNQAVIEILYNKSKNVIWSNFTQLEVPPEFSDIKVEIKEEFIHVKIDSTANMIFDVKFKDTWIDNCERDWHATTYINEKYKKIYLGDYCKLTYDNIDEFLFSAKILY